MRGNLPIYGEIDGEPAAIYRGVPTRLNVPLDIQNRVPYLNNVRIFTSHGDSDVDDGLKANLSSLGRDTTVGLSTSALYKSYASNQGNLSLRYGIEWSLTFSLALAPNFGFLELEARYSEDTKLIVSEAINFTADAPQGFSVRARSIVSATARRTKFALDVLCQFNNGGREMLITVDLLIPLSFSVDSGNALTSSILSLRRLHNTAVEPFLNIRAQTDLWGQGQLAQVVFTSTGVEPSSQYLSTYEKYVITVVTENCPSFSSKALAITNKFYTPLDILVVQEKLLFYGLLRYYLWRLIIGPWTLEILRRRYTEFFYAVLRASPYAIFYDVLTSPELAEYEGYFVY